MTDLLRTLEEINEAGKQLTVEVKQVTAELTQANADWENKSFDAAMRILFPCGKNGSEAMDAFTDGHSGYDR